VSFYVRCLLDSGLIRFSVGPRDRAESFDGPLSSTTATGEYKRFRPTGQYFGEQRAAASLAGYTSAAALPSGVWEFIRSSGPRFLYGSVAAFIFGGLMVLLGLAVTARKGLHGLIEVLIGVAIIATPFVLSWQRLRSLREARERERRARAEEEARQREKLGRFANALVRLQQTPDSSSLADIRAQRQAMAVPYEVVAAPARETVLHIAFDAISRLDAIGAAGVMREIDDAADAVGLTGEDAGRIKANAWQKLVWHLLADDRLDAAREATLGQLRAALSLDDSSVEREQRAISSFRALRRTGPGSLAELDSDLPLRFREKLHLKTGATLMRTSRSGGWIEVRPATLYVTSRRLIIRRLRKRIEIPLPRVFDLEVDIDSGVLTIVIAGRKSYSLALEEPIVAAATIGAAAEHVQT
jgi:hypothetical protein